MNENLSASGTRPKVQHLLRVWVGFAFFFVATLAQAQDGPFGVGNATGADGQPKLLFWLDGSTPSVANGQDVLVWPDRSGNGNDFTTSAALSPVLHTSGGPQNRPFLRFNRANNRMKLENFEFSEQGVSIFYVLKTADPEYGMFSFAESDANPRKVLTHEEGGENYFTIDSAEEQTPQGPLSNGVWRYAGFVWDGSGTTYWHRSSGDGSPEQTESGVLSGESNIGTGTAVIGHIQNLLNGGYVPTEAFDGDLAEIFVYDGKVGVHVLRMMNTYFRNKYDVGAIYPWDKLQAPSSHREGLIGIGRDHRSPNQPHLYSKRDGLVLFANPGGILGSHAYLSGGHSGVANSVVNSNLPATVEARWNRDWFIRDHLGSGSEAQIGFDFSEGINGDFPTNPSEYVLLYRNSSTGTFSIQSVIETFIVDDRVMFRVSASQLSGGRYYTLGTRNQIVSSLTGAEARTWYAYQSGDWSDPLTWTLDGSAAPYYINPDGAIPAAGDIATIGSGRTVTADVSTALLKLILHGTLDLGTQPSHSYTTLEGSGLLRCAGSGGNSNFPAGNTALFADPVQGGRVVFYGTGFTQSADIEVNELTIDLNSASQKVIMDADLVHNGRFEVERGIFQVNDNSNVQRTFDSHDDVWVGPNGRIWVSPSTPGTMHLWNFHGDLINDGGEVKFTNRTAQTSSNYINSESHQYIKARFVSGTRNQKLLANGLTYLSRLIINKGEDDSYVFTVSADSPGDFLLLGKANSSTGQDDPSLDESHHQNAFAVVNGTAEIGENVFIPLNRSGNYNINESATLWINGGTVAKGAPHMLGADNSVAIVPYGKIKVTSGELYANCESGITLRANGVLQVDGGYVEANQIRTSVYGPTNIGGIIINGGVLNVDGTKPGGVNSSYYTFSLTYPGNVFRMTGGELRVAGPNRGLIFINSDPEQTAVTGGTVIAEIKTGTPKHYLTTRAPLWNLEVERTTTSGDGRLMVVDGSSGGESIPHLPLYIENSLLIRGANAPVLRMYGSSGTGADLHIRGNMTVENGGDYHHGYNTTYFDGNVNSVLSLPTTTMAVGSQYFDFNNLVIDKDLDSRYVEIIGGHVDYAFEVADEFRLERGELRNTQFNLSLLGDVVVRSTVGTETSTGTVYVEGVVPQSIESDNGVFHNLTVDNVNDVTLSGGPLTVRKQMSLADGNFHLGPHRLRVEGPDGLLNVSSPDASRCFTTDGSASAGGLQVVFTAGNQQTLFPVGVYNGTTVKYTPAEVKINGFFSDPGLMAVAPVDRELETVDQTGGNSYLDFFWRVTGEDFNQSPKVSYRFQYDAADIVGDLDSLASGRVLLDSPFERQVDSLNTAGDHVNTGTGKIYFNAVNQGQSLNGAGVPLVDADYSAGNWPRFTGRPEVYYSRSSVYNSAWNNAANWNELSAFSGGDDAYDWHGTVVPQASDYPQAGDLAFIGFDPTTGKPHVYEAPAGGVQAARVSFTPLQTPAGDPKPRWNGSVPADITVLRPTLSFSATSDIDKIGQISGEGALLISGDADLSATDVSDFLSRDSSIVILQTPPGAMSFSGLPSEVPNLFVTTTGNGSQSGGPRITTNLTVRNKLEIAGNADLYVSPGAAGDIKVGGDLVLDKYQATTSGPRVLFENTGVSRTLVIQGSVFIRGLDAKIEVLSPNTYAPQTIHRMTVYEDIVQNAPMSTGLNLSAGPTHDYIELELRGSGNHEFFNLNGNAPKLGRLIVDKGLGVSSSFSFNSEFSINGPTNQPDKAVTLVNGLLKINDPGIDVTLSNGGGDFVIPATAGLRLDEGTLRVNGNGVGLLLAGHLEVNGGLFEIGNTDGNDNYLEYSSGGISYLEVGGGTLSVGSQLRRGLTNTDGILDYRQTGGDVLVGVHAAPESNRGVFEVTNDGSRFDLTGGTLTLVRGVNSSVVPSLLIDPTTHNVNGNGHIVVGHVGSPNDAQIKNIGIQTFINLSNLEINNDSGNDPVAKLYATPLTLTDDLTIDAGATLDCLLPDLTVRGDIVNDGVLEASNNLLTIDHSTTGTVAGTGVFNLGDVDRTGGGTTEVNADLTVNGDFFLDAGIMNFGTNTMVVSQSATVDGTMSFSPGGTGLTLAGGAGQMLQRTGGGSSHIDILTTDNPQGITMQPGAGHLFTIGEELRMKRGIFDLKGNLLQLGVNATITQVNAFGESNMISTGGAYTNYGVRKSIPANTTTDVLMPLGIDRYTPIRLIFSDTDYSSGNTVSTYTFRLNQPYHTVIVDDGETPPDPEINDMANVLQMYFTMDAENVGAGLKMTAEFMYHDDKVAVTPPRTEDDYIGARVVNASPTPQVYKFLGAVSPSSNIISIDFDGVSDDGISGDYFAGVDYAIPDIVPVFETVRSGNVNEGSAPGGVYDQAVSGGGAPNGAVVWIRSGHELTLNINGVNLYKTILDPTSVLVVDETNLHRLGIIEGTGTIRLINSGDLPSASYNEFFTCSGGKLEYAGTGNYSVLANIPVVRGVSFTGSGQRNMPNNDVQVCEDLTVAGPQLRIEHGTKLTVKNDVWLTGGMLNTMQGDLVVEGDVSLTGGDFSAGNMGTRHILGDIHISSGTFGVGSGGQVELEGNLTKTGGGFDGGSGSTVKFVFSGDTPQHVDGDFTGGAAFRTMEIDNTHGLTLFDNVDVEYKLLLTDGNIFTGVDSVLKLTTHTATVIPADGSPNSFVDGPMEWTLNSNGNKIFPVGNEDRYRPLTLYPFPSPDSRTWTVEHFKGNPILDPAINSLDPANPYEVKEVSRQEYWKVNSNTVENTTARVGLSWGDSSIVAPAPADYQKLVVMDYDFNNDNWINRGAQLSSFNYDPVSETGTFMSQNPSSFTERIFTLGSEDEINPLPVTWLYFRGKTVSDHHVLEWATASEMNSDYYSLQRSSDGREWVEVGRVAAAGNSNQRLSYRFTDREAPLGRVYYRLIQFDFDGTRNVAPEPVTLYLSGQAESSFEFLLYPNPATGYFHIRSTQVSGRDVWMQISDMGGRVLQTRDIHMDHGGTSLPLEVDLPAGIYIVRIVKDDESMAKPLVIR